VFRRIDPDEANSLLDAVDLDEERVAILHVHDGHPNPGLR